MTVKQQSRKAFSIGWKTHKVVSLSSGFKMCQVFSWERLKLFALYCVIIFKSFVKEFKNMSLWSFVAQKNKIYR